MYKQSLNYLLGAEADDTATTVLIIKIVFIFVAFAIALVFGILPAKVKGCGQNPTFMSLANAFSGGLFLAIALVHILPDVVSEYTEWHEANEDPVDPPANTTIPGELGHPRLKHGDGESLFPLPYILVFCGYTFILLVDRVMFDSHSLFDHGHGGHGHGHGHGEEEEHDHDHDHHHSNANDKINNTNSIITDIDNKSVGHAGSNLMPPQPQQQMYNPGGKGHEHGHGGHHGHHDPYMHDPATQKLITGIKRSMIATQEDISHGSNVKKSMIQEQQEITDNIRSYLSRADQFAVRMSAAIRHSVKKSQAGAHGEQNELFVDKDNVNLVKTTHGHDHSEIDPADGKKVKEKCNLTPFVLMIALSVHGIFEGIALGLMKDISQCVNLVISILIHKFAESMSICIAMTKSKMEFKEIFKFILLFSFATPLGTTLGIILNETNEMVSIVFTSMAGGTFIYVSCSELIVEEFSLPGNRWLKLLAFIIGAVLIACLLLLE